MFLNSDIAHVSCDPIKGAHIQARDQPGSYLSNLTIKCEPGYEYNGTQTRICQLNNTWSGVDGMCIRELYAYYYLKVDGSNLFFQTNYSYIVTSEVPILLTVILV